MKREQGASIKIDGSQSFDDITEKYGIYVLSGGTGIPIGQFSTIESISYPEEVGERIYPYVKQEPFDYTIKLACKSDGVFANSIIMKFIGELYEYENNDGLIKLKNFYLHNYYQNALIYGVMKSYEPSDIISPTDDNDIICFDLTIRVFNPSKCNFSYE